MGRFSRCLLGLACGLLAVPANATYHVVVIDQMFPGFEPAPGAQFVMLRNEFAAQTFVHRQTISTFGPDGTALTNFAAFCSTCDLPASSPACTQGDCPDAFGGNDAHVLIATAWARDLFCVTPDLLATGTLPYPDGRVCWADTGRVFGPTCLATGPVDCVAYGQFSGDNGLFGTPVASPPLGQALVGEPARLAQCDLVIDRTAVCVGGDDANMACPPSPCTNGTCETCPQGSCRSLLSSAAGFSAGAPTPQNFHGDLGAIDGVAGDAQGTGTVDPGDVRAELDTLFEADHRCDLPTTRRGADANFDTRISAADLIVTVQIVTTS